MRDSELGMIDAIRRAVGDAPAEAGVTLGVGDDTAVLALTPGAPLLATTDTMVEDVHFRFAWTSPVELGRKLAATNLSDIAAMGGRPRWATLALSLPRGVAPAEFQGLLDGLLARLATHDTALVGGDLTRSPGPWVLSVTLLGEAPPDGALRRDGARDGDELWLLGSVGDAALALRQLEDGARPAPEERLGAPWNALLDPLPRCAFGAALGRSALATAAIDVSDGLLRDLGHLCAASGVDAALPLEALPLSPPLDAVVTRDPEAGWALALGGGEDYALLFTAPPRSADALRTLHDRTDDPGPLRRIGRLQAGQGAVRCTLRGAPFAPKCGGWDHFD